MAWESLFDGLYYQPPLTALNLAHRRTGLSGYYPPSFAHYSIILFGYYRRKPAMLISICSSVPTAIWPPNEGQVTIALI